jgi:hypothetical protein
MFKDPKGREFKLGVSPYGSQNASGTLRELLLGQAPLELL